MFVKPGMYGYQQGDKFKGKSRGVSVQSILGDDGAWSSANDDYDEEEKDDRDQRWFEYLDEVCKEHWENGVAVLDNPHKKLILFGAAASYEEVWLMAGFWVETDRKIGLNSAGIKRQGCVERSRATELVPLAAALNDCRGMLSERHSPEWLGTEDDKIADDDEQENSYLALAHDWENE